MKTAYNNHEYQMKFIIISICISINDNKGKKSCEDTRNLERWKKEDEQEDHKIWFLDAATFHPCKEAH